MINLTKYVRSINLLLVLFFLSSFGSAQTLNVQGIVTDKSKTPIPGISIQLKGTTVGTVTDAGGKYNLVVDGDSPILIFSFIGMKTQEIKVDGRTNINIAMADDIVNLEELVVVGYGVQRKSDITGSVASIKSEELQMSLSPNIDQALQGRAAGVTVTSNSGSPGASSTVRIRGVGTVNNADPLYIVDGVPLGNINSLNMQDVESMEILKDASATAIYGSRGANGVILIKTKSGSNSKMTFSYSGRLGTQSMSNKIDLVNAQQYAILRNKARATDYANSPSQDWTPIPDLANPEALGEGTDWQDAVFRDAILQDHQLSVSGGSDKSTYYISLNAMEQEGIVKGTDYKRITFRVNNTYKLNERFNLGHNINFGYTDRNTIPESGHGNVAKQKILTNAIGHEPVTPIYDPTNPDSKYGYTKLGGNYGNPVARIDLNNNTTGTYNISGNVYAEYKAKKYFTLRTSYGLNLGFSENYNFTPAYKISPLQFENVSSLQKSNTTNVNHTWTNTANYTRDFGNHKLTGLLGHEVQTSAYKFVRSGIKEIPANIKQPSLEAGNKATATVSDNITESALVSFFGRVNYNYDDRYLMTINFRADGSSKFGPGNRWGYFPSIAGGWNAHNEKFFPDTDVISRLKITAGWGEIGNQSFADYRYYSMISGGQYYYFSNKLVAGAAPLMLGNENLKWETTKSSNVAINIGLFNDMLTLGAEYFEKNTTDMLMQLPIPQYAGIRQSPWSNAGNLRNTGWEFTLDHRRDVNENFSYGINGNISFIKNEVLSLGTESGFIEQGQFQGFPLLTRTEVGRSIGEFYLLDMEGIFQNEEEVANSAQSNAQPGDVRFADVNGDGKIDDNDRTFVGSALPNFTYAFSLNVAYKQLSLTAFFQGVSGNKIFNSPRYFNDRSGPYGISTRMLNAWDGEGSTNEIPRLTEKDVESNLRASDYFLESGTYLRLKNLEVAYTLSNKLCKKAGIQSLRIFLSGQNLWTLTDYSGMDPEIGIENGDVLAFGIDRGMYPQARVYSIGLNLNI
ncbi:SusC/RagA family TonB-linked outer membrane protein [Flammeovirga aprica]|uniref:TonB-dependent receptor n=1 Tax=Flammeovirga aprica JL-4 TaxID=694437 RepID=A0A7X9S186_9BACT|nr:TonB-dependent receptor [Flammeovirga aprica]NME72557.1 TonB-dependent receptor [Flammeovirga aprica JL-4]